MNFRAFVSVLALLPATGAAAAPFSSGDWEAARIGSTCLVYNNAPARDTSGSLQFSFDVKGYNADFTYEYAPYTENEEDPGPRPTWLKSPSTGKIPGWEERCFPSACRTLTRSR